MKKITTLLSTLLLTALLSACGMKGPLYITPDEPQPAPQKTEQETSDNTEKTSD